ncbi:hypothetical protein [Aquimarina latercula]|uniref:hypothetical protein n=1 Tax=Aquimarina latercula TaxID=987 RepID=UPI000489CEE3|nr:hypothetical protein [Aquimarina latercula]
MKTNIIIVIIGCFLLVSCATNKNTVALENEAAPKKEIKKTPQKKEKVNFTAQQVLYFLIANRGG